MISDNYFKGWYFKCASQDRMIAFIPAFHRHRGRVSASLQIITDESAFNLPVKMYQYSERPLDIRSAGCHFSEKGIQIDIDRENVHLHGAITFGPLCPIRYDIMGPFALVPFMQCKHHVYSMKHRIDGKIVLNGQTFLFRNDIGYIEGDSGSSFPSKYLWTQCPCREGSVMLSVADIPFAGFHFTGVIGVITLGQKEYRIATYLGAHVKRINNRRVTVTQGPYELTVTLMAQNALPLLAPNRGDMVRTIHESGRCQAHYRLTCHGKPLCDFIGDKASFESEWAHQKGKPGINTAS